MKDLMSSEDLMISEACELTSSEGVKVGIAEKELQKGRIESHERCFNCNATASFLL